MSRPSSLSTHLRVTARFHDALPANKLATHTHSHDRCGPEIASFPRPFSTNQRKRPFAKRVRVVAGSVCSSSRSPNPVSTASPADTSGPRSAAHSVPIIAASSSIGPEQPDERSPAAPLAARLPNVPCRLWDRPSCPLSAPKRPHEDFSYAPLCGRF